MKVFPVRSSFFLWTAPGVAVLWLAVAAIILCGPVSTQHPLVSLLRWLAGDALRPALAAATLTAQLSYILVHAKTAAK